MSAELWEFWRAQLAHQAGHGDAPETNPGTPGCGYYLSHRYVSLPFAVPTRKGGSVVRPKVMAPVAIWQADGEWFANVTMPHATMTLTHTDTVDDLFAGCCRDAIDYERYVEMTDAIANWRNGGENEPR